MIADAFAPFEQLFRELEPVVVGSSGDGSHDLSHLVRVWRMARRIALEEGGDLRLVAASVMLHDCVVVEKDSPLRGQASRMAAEKAAEVLAGLGWEAGAVETVAGAILTHSYSAGLVPVTLEGRILQDADRLDAIGMVGVARCFYTAGRMGSRLYDPFDPAGAGRVLDDRSFAIDHFPLKLLRLAGGFETASGARIAQQRHAQLLAFYERFMEELDG